SKEFVLRAVGSQILRVNVLKERPRRNNFLSIHYSTAIILVYRNEHPGYIEPYLVKSVKDMEIARSNKFQEGFKLYGSKGMEHANHTVLSQINEFIENNRINDSLQAGDIAA
ncbi:2543_t:CDS:2, partial [Funneliformis caledonium]